MIWYLVSPCSVQVKGCCLSTRFLMGYDKMLYHAQKLDVRVAISLLQSFGMPVPSTRWRSKMI